MPITALRVTPPRHLAIWLAERPSAQSRPRAAIRSALQAQAVEDMAETSSARARSARTAIPAFAFDRFPPRTPEDRQVKY
ncbi:hypothetical protein [Caulobacter hibisci]|uniref:hypothetical protein n=1 Tax=Caulobacter hibisci TaxID=2035993 RepID=UPI001E4B6A0E|nr:hypothetical protein [Caulobacter hibisci]